jgi:hypothetical protein
MLDDSTRREPPWASCKPLQLRRVCRHGLLMPFNQTSKRPHIVLRSACPVTFRKAVKHPVIQRKSNHLVFRHTFKNFQAACLIDISTPNRSASVIEGVLPSRINARTTSTDADFIAISFETASLA